MAELGQAYRLQGSADGVTYTTVGAMNSFEITHERGTTEVNTFDNPNWRELLGTMQEWSISGDVYYVYTDAGQAIVRASMASDEPYYWRIQRADALAGSYEWTGQGYATETSVSGEMNDPMEMSISIEGTGELLHAAIAA